MTKSTYSAVFNFGADIAEYTVNQAVVLIRKFGFLQELEYNYRSLQKIIIRCVRYFPMKNSIKHDVLTIAVVVFFVGVLISSVSISDVFSAGEPEQSTALNQGANFR